MENVNEIARITSGFDRRKNGHTTHRISQNFIIFNPVYPSKDVPTFQQLGLKSLRLGWDGPT